MQWALTPGPSPASGQGRSCRGGGTKTIADARVTETGAGSPDGDRTVNLILIGYRATGKTPLARLLAERLGYLPVDADVEIEHRAGKPIAQDVAEKKENRPSATWKLVFRMSR